MTRNPVGDNEAFSAVYWSAILNAHDGEFVETGLVPSKGTGSFDVDYTAGTAHNDEEDAVVAAGTVTLTSADATNPRVDLVTIDPTDGSVQGVTGTAAADPVAPDIPDGDVLIAAVYVPGGAASLTAGDIHDYRVVKGVRQDEAAMAVQFVLGGGR